MLGRDRPAASQAHGHSCHDDFGLEIGTRWKDAQGKGRRPASGRVEPGTAAVGGSAPSCPRAPSRVPQSLAGSAEGQASGLVGGGGDRSGEWGEEPGRRSPTTQPCPRTGEETGPAGLCSLPTHRPWSTASLRFVLPPGCWAEHPRLFTGRRQAAVLGREWLSESSGTLVHHPEPRAAPDGVSESRDGVRQETLAQRGTEGLPALREMPASLQEAESGARSPPHAWVSCLQSRDRNRLTRGWLGWGQPHRLSARLRAGGLGAPGSWCETLSGSFHHPLPGNGTWPVWWPWAGHCLS